MHRETLCQQFRFSAMVIKANVGEITHEESLVQPAPAGNCVNWVLGHLVGSRSNMLKMFGEAPVWSEEQCARYDRHGDPITSAAEAEPLDAIWRAFDTGQDRLLNVIAALPDEKFSEKAPFSPAGDPDETIGSLLSTVAFHDAYHAGQTGVLRRIIGKPPADL